MPTATVPARISDVSTIALSISHSFFNKGASAQRDFGYNWSTVSLTKFQIAAHLLHGKAIAVAALRNGHRQTGAFLSAQIILIDLDSGPDVQTLAEDPFIQQHAFLIYATSSSTPEQPRSRLAFVLDTLVTDPGLYKQWVKRLQADFGRKGFIVDVACKDAVRMFFGSHQAERVLFETNVLPLTYLESLPDSKRMPKTKAVASAERPQTERHLPPMSDPEREAQARQIASALAVIPVDQPYNEWIDTLMAVHSAFPDERGLQLVEVSPLNYSGEAAEKWWSFQPARQGGITIDTLWFLARRYGWGLPARVPADKTVTTAYMTDVDLPFSGTLLMNSGTGTGKSEFMKRFVEQKQKEQKARVSQANISHRRSLTLDISQRFKIANYQGLSPAEIRQHDQLAITINSLPKLIADNGQLPEFDIVMIDEIEQVLGQLFGTTFPGAKGFQAYRILCNLIRRARWVLAADAHVGPTAYNFLKRLRPELLYVENLHHDTHRLMEMHRSHDELLSVLANMLFDQEKTVVVTCEEKTEVIALVELFASLGDQVLGIHGDNIQDPKIQSFLQHIETELPKLKLFIFNSALGSGVDIQADVDHVFGIFPGSALAPQELHQLLGRCRKATHFHVWVGRALINPDDQKEGIYQKYYQAWVRTFLECGYDPTGQRQLTQDHHDFLDLYAEITAQRNGSRNNLLNTFLALAEQNFTVSWVEGNKHGILKKMKVATQKRNAEQHALTLVADPIDEATYQGHQQAGTNTALVEAGYLRGQIEEAFGVELTEPILDHWHDGTLVQQADQLINLFRPREALIALDKSEERAGIPPQNRQHGALKRKTIRMSLAAIFGSEFHFRPIDEKPFYQLLNGPFAQVQADHWSDLQLLLNRSSTQSKVHQTILRDILRSIGLQFAPTTYTGKNRRNKFYTLDRDHYEWMLDLARARSVKLDLRVDWSRSPLGGDASRSATDVVEAA